MKYILLLFTLIPALTFGQKISKEGLWKAHSYIKKDGTEQKATSEDFLKVKNNALLLFQFQQKMSRETGEMFVVTVVDTFNIGKLKSDGSYNLSLKERTFSFSEVDKKLHLIFPNYTLVFERIEKLGKPTISLEQCSQFLIGSTVVEIDPERNKIEGNLSYTYQPNGQAKYKQLDARRSWESEYKIIDFEGYTFLKGITSAPVLLTSNNNKSIAGTEFDFRYEPKPITLMKVEFIDDSFKPEQLINQPFELEIENVSTEECIEKLPKDVLDLELNITKGLLDKEVTTVQVQHSYGCSWNLIRDGDIQGFSKATFKELIDVDPSLCYIATIPCGYYADRDSKKDPWKIYLHEERMETDSSFITKKAFKHDNTYRVINELKEKELTHFKYYYLDSRKLRKTFSFLKGKEVGITRFYDEDGVLEKEVDNDE